MPSTARISPLNTRTSCSTSMPLRPRSTIAPTYRFVAAFQRSGYPGAVVLRSMCICLLALVIAPVAWAARGQVLAPGIAYERRLEFTRHGPVVIHVLTAPKPGGLYSLEPALSNGVIPGRETVSQMQRRLSPTTTAV